MDCQAIEQRCPKAVIVAITSFGSCSLDWRRFLKLFHAFLAGWSFLAKLKRDMQVCIGENLRFVREDCFDLEQMRRGDNIYLRRYGMKKSGWIRRQAGSDHSSGTLAFFSCSTFLVIVLLFDTIK